MGSVSEERVEVLLVVHARFSENENSSKLAIDGSRRLCSNDEDRFGTFGQGATLKKDETEAERDSSMEGMRS